MIKHLKLDTRFGNAVVEVSEEAFTHLADYEIAIEEELELLPLQPSYVFSYDLEEKVLKPTTLRNVRFCEHRNDMFKIYRYMDSLEYHEYPDLRKCPIYVNYNFLPLYEKVTYEKGLRVKVEYYSSYDDLTGVYENLVVQEDHRYLLYPGRLIPRIRDVEISWYKQNDLVGYNKTIRTYFDANKAAKLHEKRKEQNIVELKNIIYQTMLVAKGEAEGLNAVLGLFDDLNSDMQTYVQGHEQILISRISVYDNPDIDLLLPGQNLTLRDYLINQLSLPKGA